MKISEMTNDQASEAMLRLSTPFANICDDDEMKAIFEEIDSMGKNGVSVIKAVGKVIPKFLTFGLKAHKQDIYEIVAALQLIPVGQIGKMNFVQTIKTVRESYDDVLASFFPHSDTQTQRDDVA